MKLRYFQYLKTNQEESIFYKSPREFSKDTNKEQLQLAVGALLYVPATKKDIAKMVLEAKYEELVSLAICLEDAIGDKEVEAAVTNLKSNLEQLKDMDKDKLPLIFIRVRNVEVFGELKDLFIKYAQVLTGVILPKVTLENIEQYLEIVEGINREIIGTMYCMPILESKEIMTSPNRMEMLQEYKQTFDRYKNYVLNVRLGGADFCGLFGLRRSRHHSIYDIAVVRQCITDIINVFGIGRQYTISGPVWEYFSKEKKMEAFMQQQETKGLIKEILLDIDNGLLGKTSIHPTQVRLIQSMYPVSYEEYKDAERIVESEKSQKGVANSLHNNKMNETKPHWLWANVILHRAEIYGVYHAGKDYLDIMREMEDGIDEF